MKLRILRRFDKLLVSNHNAKDISQGIWVLTKRRQRVLMALIDEYVMSAVPVGSTRIAEHYLKEVSSATVRNELMELVADGYAISPHTSAGRIPTNTGYRVFVNNIMLRSDYQYNAKASKMAEKLPVHEMQNLDAEHRITKILSYISEYTGLLSMLWMLKPDSVVYHRGLPQLLMQPEFHQSTMLIPLMQLLEDESALNALFLSTLKNKGFAVKIGMEDADGQLTSYSAVAEVIGHEQPQALLAVFGPTRMDYRKVIPSVFIAARLLASAQTRLPIW